MEKEEIKKQIFKCYPESINLLTPFIDSKQYLSMYDFMGDDAFLNLLLKTDLISYIDENQKFFILIKLLKNSPIFNLIKSYNEVHNTVHKIDNIKGSASEMISISRRHNLVYSKSAADKNLKVQEEYIICDYDKQTILFKTTEKAESETKWSELTMV